MCPAACDEKQCAQLHAMRASVLRAWAHARDCVTGAGCSGCLHRQVQVASNGSAAKRGVMGRGRQAAHACVSLQGLPGFCPCWRMPLQPRGKQCQCACFYSLPLCSATGRCCMATSVCSKVVCRSRCSVAGPIIRRRPASVACICWCPGVKLRHACACVGVSKCSGSWRELGQGVRTAPCFPRRLWLQL